MDNQVFRQLFDEITHDRFLMHLIGHHICAIRYGIVGASIGENDGTVIYPIVGRFFPHSCYPNAVLVTSDRMSIAITIRPIEEGEKVTIAYFPDELELPIRERRQHLLEQYRILCMCERCDVITQAADNGLEAQKKVYEQSKRNIANPSNVDPKKQPHRQKQTNRCIKYLEENGRDKWCKKMSLKLHTYMQLLRTKHYFNLPH